MSHSETRPPEHCGMEFEIRQMSEAPLVPQLVPEMNVAADTGTRPLIKRSAGNWGRAVVAPRIQFAPRDRAEPMPVGHASDSRYRGTQRED